MFHCFSFILLQRWSSMDHPSSRPSNRPPVTRPTHLRLITPDSPTVCAPASAHEAARSPTEFAPGISIDPTVEWNVASLVRIGCPPEVAADLVVRSTETPPRPATLPCPPAIPIPSVALAGLAPVGVVSGEPNRIGPSGWRRWAAAARERTRSGRANRAPTSTHGPVDETGPHDPSSTRVAAGRSR